MMLIYDWSNGPPEPFLRPIATSESSLFVDTIYKLRTIVELKLSMGAKREWSPGDVNRSPRFSS